MNATPFRGLAIRAAYAAGRDDRDADLRPATAAAVAHRVAVALDHNTATHPNTYGHCQLDDIEEEMLAAYATAYHTGAPDPIAALPDAELARMIDRAYAGAARAWIEYGRAGAELRELLRADATAADAYHFRLAAERAARMAERAGRSA